MAELVKIPLTNLINWSVRFLLESSFNYNPDFELVHIDSLLKKNNNRIQIENDVLYKRITVKSKNNGVILRDEVKGEQIGTKNQFKVKSGQFILSKIDARNGAFGIIPTELDGAIVTNDFPTYDINKKLVIPDFFLLITTTKEFIKFAQSCSVGTTNRQRIDMEMFLMQQIPLPTLTEQNRIVSQYGQKIKLAQQQQEEADIVGNGIEEYLMNRLSLKKLEFKENIKGLQLISFKNIDRWDILAKDMRILNGLATSTFQLRKLGDVFSFANRSWNKKDYDKETFRYIELGAIDTIEGITEVKELNVKKAPSRATQQVVEGDFLIGTTRPYLKRFVIIDSNYDGDICSSGFAILEPNQKTELAYLKEFLMSYYGLEQLKNRMTGATYPAITSSELKEILVPFPPKFIQTEIASEIKKMRDKIRELQNKAQLNKGEALKQFEQEIFN
ncbi:restriction endonuclease subunit S [Mariniflexile gromovii]|uniref:Restriction endonuclease subunit S n=1 Tax=Mariniflexile gromovii TaxID=362523 RepID=A0ABS4BNN5_9FLAO|nr:restriction endonuclease subunit S [Mariniflexile gromovii]MBP0902211.1 restriction endonuclease subunit S [Mariniflexile gromovii]